MKARSLTVLALPVGMALLALLILGEALHPTAYAEPEPQVPASAVSSPEIVIYLPGNSGPLDTGVSVRSNDLISIRATGVIFNGMTYFDPDGGLSPHRDLSPIGGEPILPDIATNSLVGSIGDFETGALLDDGADVNPSGISGAELGYPGLFGPGYFGSSFEGIASAQGNIYLAFNDYPLGDNVGGFQVSIVISPTGTITKSVDSPFAVTGERRTYQIVISPERDIATARLTDTLPSAVTWAGDLSATSGNASHSGGAVTWSGPLANGAPVTITYGVTVTLGTIVNHAPHHGTVAYTDIYTDVYNDAVLDDGQGNTFNSSAAVFAIGRPFGTGSDRTFDLAFGDADSDGHLDLAVGNYGQNQMCWNNGDGTFDCTDAFGGSNTNDVKWGDMDNDGDLDLVAANFLGNWNHICLNNGDRTFTCTGFSLCSGGQTNCFAALGDVDNDGDLDIALGNMKDQDLIYYNDGTGTFITGTTCYDGATEDLAFGDMNGDEWLDLVVVGASPDFVCINDGTGHFTLPPCWLTYRIDYGTWRVALGDADNDGDLDVAAAEQNDYPNEVYLNDGDGCHFSRTLLVGPAWEKTWGLAWGDVDNDGDLDLATANQYQQTVLYFNDPATATGSVNFTRRVFLNQGSHRALSVAFGDVNGDCGLDLAVGNDGEQNVIYLNNLVRCIAYLPLVIRNHP